MVRAPDVRGCSPAGRPGLRAGSRCSFHGGLVADRCAENAGLRSPALLWRWPTAPPRVLLPSPFPCDGVLFPAVDVAERSPILPLMPCTPRGIFTRDLRFSSPRPHISPSSCPVSRFRASPSSRCTVLTCATSLFFGAMNLGAGLFASSCVDNSRSPRTSSGVR